MTDGFDADLLVVGGGPAGLATALHARRAGLSVIVAEPRATPIDKACGEGVMPGGLARLAGLGIDPPGVPFHGIGYRDNRERLAEARFAAGPGRGIRRTELQAAMIQAVELAGVERITARVTELAQDASGVAAAGVRTRWLVAADGLHSTVRRAAGIGVVAGSPRRYGLRRHWRVRPWSDLVEVWWAQHAEAYVTPVGPDLVGVAILHRRHADGGASYDRLLRGFPALSDRLAQATPAGPVHGAGPLRQVVDRRVSGRVLLVGDAAGYCDALTGEGISLALGQAAAAVRALVAQDPSRYEASWRTDTRRYRWLTRSLVLLTAARPVRRMVVPLCAALPSVLRGPVHMLAG